MKDLIANSSNNWVKTIGVYIIIILALLRFLIYPLHAITASPADVADA